MHDVAPARDTAGVCNNTPCHYLIKGTFNGVVHFQPASLPIQQGWKLIGILRRGVGKNGVTERQATFEQSPHLIHILWGPHYGALPTGDKQQDFIEADTFVPQEVKRMGAEEYLATGSATQARHGLRQLTNYSRMERQLGFLERRLSASAALTSTSR